MNKLTRPASPPFLAERCRDWNERFAKKRAENPACEFRWPMLEGTPLNQHLRPLLRAMTQQHCAYCDGFPLGEMSRETIDHFRPKSQSPQLAHTWENLFPACEVCQEQKGESFDEALLRPDDIAYRFERYFIYNEKTGELDPNPAAAPAEQEQARTAIKIFDLNRTERASSRVRQKKLFVTLERVQQIEQLHDFPYRFILEP